MLASDTENDQTCNKTGSNGKEDFVKPESSKELLRKEIEWQQLMGEELILRKVSSA